MNEPKIVEVDERPVITGIGAVARVVIRDDHMMAIQTYSTLYGWEYGGAHWQDFEIASLADKALLRKEDWSDEDIEKILTDEITGRRFPDEIAEDEL